ncbi:Domain of uncharacterised function (DUF2825) [Bordetella ansorpii]|uniref:Domain of uncharacterized function (DUF2825) n=1 Tax=Bordetella ansorpii TaxID=288768 RepID=A0A157SBX5_9BORD|nr:Domain of uncharacterised function (DUF2825) [Bordetella ansorpii]
MDAASSRFDGSSPHTRGTRAHRCRRRGCRPVHPRIRGEHVDVAPVDEDVNGSSPHTRGTHPGAAGGVGHVRFIPAYAGNTGLSKRARNSNSVHPRIRGEHVFDYYAPAGSRGSSPHTRGTLDPPYVHSTRARFIPAYAGNTRRPSVPCRTLPVHPRIRGEHGPASPPAATHRGSSPHTRGTLNPGRPPPRYSRFIPAYAGNTCSAPARQPPASVHPRIRGEHFLGAAMAEITIGSSPHTRGTLVDLAGVWRGGRFIPAYAGNTSGTSESTAATPVHPRIRGEHCFGMPARRSKAGSSPHTRGTLEHGLAQVTDGRFIPAYAGNTWRGSSARLATTVHPRIRGEHADNAHQHARQ